MSELNENLQPNGNEINLKHFIYLDRHRLTSYLSQLSDGIAGQMNLSLLWEPLVGKVDIVLEPIAIYAETNGN